MTTIVQYGDLLMADRKGLVAGSGDNTFIDVTKVFKSDCGRFLVGISGKLFDAATLACQMDDIRIWLESGRPLATPPEKMKNQQFIVCTRDETIVYMGVGAATLADRAEPSAIGSGGEQAILAIAMGFTKPKALYEHISRYDLLTGRKPDVFKISELKPLEVEK